MLQQVGLLQGTELAGLKPDLLGEYFVLQHLKKQEVLQLLFPDGWQAKGKLVAFLFRMYLDYHDALENMEIFWNYMLCSPVDTVMGYGMIWVNVAWFSNNYAVPAVEILKALWAEGGKQEMDALLYAMGLVNLIHKEELAEAEDSVEWLRKLQKQYFGNEKIALVYAKGLFNLAYNQGLERAEAIVERLRELQEQYCGNEEIALVYAQGLYNLSCDQDVAEAEASVERLRELQERYSGNEEIALEYAKGLVKRSQRRAVKGTTGTVLWE